MAYEEPPFNIIHETDVYEIRHYVNRLAVQATNNKQNSTFRMLFNYISGKNTNSEKIKMTTPVTQLNENSDMVMQFYLPETFTEETAPTPTDPRVKLVTIKEGYYAVIQYSGRNTYNRFIKYTKILHKALIKDGINMNEIPIKASYNGPFTLPILRRNEAMYSINWKQ